MEAWCGVLAYSLQLYFDFSGYSDMAIGLSRLFGVNLPLNFHSPYKAVNIAELWNRWAYDAPHAFCAITYLSRWAGNARAHGGAIPA
jgi:hypothetical protein